MLECLADRESVASRKLWSFASRDYMYGEWNPKDFGWGLNAGLRTKNVKNKNGVRRRQSSNLPKFISHFGEYTL